MNQQEHIGEKLHMAKSVVLPENTHIRLDVGVYWDYDASGT